MVREVIGAIKELVSIAGKVKNCDGLFGGHIPQALTYVSCKRQRGFETQTREGYSRLGAQLGKRSGVL